MLELAACGAKVLMLRCVEYARRFGIPIHVRSSYTTNPGTIVTGSMEDLPVEQALITGVAHDRSEAKITIVGVPDEPGEAARIFATVAAAETNIDMIVQNVSTEATGRTDISFTLPEDRRPDRDGGAGQGAGDGRVQGSAVRRPHRQGVAGRRGHALAPRAWRRSSSRAMADAGVNIEMISTSEIRVSVVCRDTDLDAAVRAVHDAFELGGDDAGRGVRRDRGGSRRCPALPTLAVVGATGAVGARDV